MYQHQLIRIDDVIHLTTRELRELEARLRHILDHDTGLTDREIVVILASLTNIRAAFDLRHLATTHCDGVVLSEA